MQRAYYKLKRGKLFNKAEEINSQIEEQCKKNQERVGKLVKEYGCDKSYYTNPNTNKIIALIFSKGIPRELCDTWKRVDGTIKGWMPKRSNKAGKELYSNIVGKDSKDINMNLAMPEATACQRRFHGFKMYMPVCYRFVYDVITNGEKKNIYIYDIPYDEMTEEAPELPSEVLKQLTHISPLKYNKLSLQYEQEVEKYNNSLKR